MSTFGKLFHYVAALALILGAVGVAPANVWIDENFDSTVAAPFTQGNGTAASGTIDRYDGDALGTPTGTLITRTGAVVATKSFSGSSSYELEAGETFSVADGYDGQAHGDWIYFQFAINVDPIPAAAGPVATWTYTNTIDTVPHVFTINANANGSGGVVLTASATQNSNPIAANGGVTTIGTLTSASQWLFLTNQFGVTGTPQKDARDPNQSGGAKAAGAYFFASSSTAAVVFPITGGATKDGGAWSLTVDGATTAKVYIDDLYWDGAREDTSNPTPADQYLKPFNTSVVDWSMY